MNPMNEKKISGIVYLILSLVIVRHVMAFLLT